jgi:general secretion pathway protein D
MPTCLRAPLCALAFVLLMAGASWAQPSDDAQINLRVPETAELQVPALLETVATKFEAILVLSPSVTGLKVKFANRANVPLTWGTIKKILRFNDVIVHESQPSGPGGPWMLQAMGAREVQTKSGGPTRFVSGKQLPDHDEVVTAVFQIQNGAASAIYANLRGILARDPTRGGNILYIMGPELLIITDATSNVRYYGRLITALDVAGPRKSLKVFPIKFAEASQLATVVTTLLQSLSGSGVGSPAGGRPVPTAGGGGGNQPQVIADERTNKLLVVAFSLDFPLVMRVINELDVKAGTQSGRYFVYKCRDSDSEDLQQKIQQLLTGQAPAAPGGAGARPGAVRPAGGGRATSLGDGGIGQVETRIVADKRTNSLLIQAEKEVYQDILALLEQLDKKSRRVLIEAEVWEITTPTDQLTIGFELAGLTNAHEDSTRPAALTAFGLSNVAPVTDANGNVSRLGRTPNLGTGITAALTRDTFDKLPVIMSALHNYSKANLVTRPFALTNDNTEAVFAINNRQPFLTTTVNQGVSQQNVQFAEANTSLTIEPQVNSLENLTLKLTLELSSFTARPSANLPPPRNSRRYQGEVTVPNAKYVVFGGLESENDAYTESKVPFLGDIPILGHLFKTWTRDRSKTKVYIFIRTTIFSNDGFGAEEQLAGHLREKAHVLSERTDWLPPIVPVRFLKGPGYTLQHEAVELFGTGSGNPFEGGGSFSDRSSDQ